MKGCLPASSSCRVERWVLLRSRLRPRASPGGSLVSGSLHCGSLLTAALAGPNNGGLTAIAKVGGPPDAPVLWLLQASGRENGQGQENEKIRSNESDRVRMTVELMASLQRVQPFGSPPFSPLVSSTLGGKEGTTVWHSCVGEKVGRCHATKVMDVIKKNLLTCRVSLRARRRRPEPPVP